MTRVYSFEKELEFSRIYETVIEPHLKQIDRFRYVRFETEKQKQLDDIDFMFDLKPIRPNTVELKIRRPVSNKYDDIVVETWSVYGKKLGWGLGSTAEFIIYAKLDRSYTAFSRAFLLETAKLREWLLAHIDDARYPKFITNTVAKGGRFSSEFMVVPLSDATAFAQEIKIELTEAEKKWVRERLAELRAGGSFGRNAF